MEDLEGKQDFIDEHSGEKFEGKLFAFERISEIEDKISVSFCITQDKHLWYELLEAFKNNKPIELTIRV